MGFPASACRSGLTRGRVLTKTDTCSEQQSKGPRNTSLWREFKPRPFVTATIAMRRAGAPRATARHRR
jgi:hypothetical protein